MIRPLVFELPSAGWQKNVRTGREQGGRAVLWREPVCQTSSSVYPPALPQCEPLIGERPSSFFPSFCMASSLAFLSAHLAGPFALFPKLTVLWLASGCICQYACLHAFVAVCLPVLVCVCGCSVGSPDILISPDLTPGWILPAICQPLDPTLPCNAAQ